jgi:hypothetical protein
MTTKRCIFQALLASFLVAIPLAFLSVTIASGSLMDNLTHRGFWLFYAKGFFWLFLTGFLASSLALLFSRNR